MADNQNTITTVFKADISNFSKSTQDLNRYIGNVNAEFANAVAGLDRWDRSQTGLQAKITQLNKILEAEKKKLDNLESAYAEMVAAGKENTAEAQKLAAAINNQSAKVKATEKNIGKYTDSLNELQAAGVETRDELDKLNKELAENEKATADAAKEAGNASGKFGGFMQGLAGVGAAAVAVVGSFVALAESTREYRNEMAKLDTAFQVNGHSAEEAEKTYKELYGILGDEARATEAAQQLAQMSKNEKDLAANTRILTGVLGTYGDSIPTEGLAEGMAATAAMGEVQGVLADALEWQGVNLDEYNEKLATMTTEEERAAYIQKTLTDLYGEAADAYEENNEAIIDANKAQADLTDVTAELGAVAEPLITLFKGIGATVLNGLLPYIKDLAGALQTVFSGDIKGGADQLGGVFDNILSKAGELAEGIISKVGELLPEILPMLGEMLSGIIQNLVGMIPTLLEAAKSLFLGIVQAIPPTVVVLLGELPKIIDSILTALSEALPLILSAAQEALMGIVDALPSVLSALVEALPLVLQSIIDYFVNTGPALYEQGIAFLMEIVKAIPSVVVSLASNLPKIIKSITETLGKNAPRIFKAGVSMLGQLLAAIPEIGLELIKNAPTIISSILEGLAGGYEAMFNLGVDMLKGLWEGMKSIGGWVWDQVSGFFNDTIVGGVKDLLGIASPSKVFAQMGEYSAEGYLGGFEDTMQHANNTLSRVNYVGAVGVADDAAVQNIGGATYNFYQTFAGMEATQYALHKAKIETLNALRLAEA